MAATKFINYLVNKNLYFIFLILITGCNSNQQDIKPKQTIAVNDSITPSKTKTILFFGNSITAGYGVDPSEAFPALIQNKIDSLKLNYKVINAGVSGETSSGGNGRVSWILRQPVDIFVL